MPHTKIAKAAKEIKTPALHSVRLSILIVEDKVMVELKSVEQTVRVDAKQVLTQLRLEWPSSWPADKLRRSPAQRRARPDYFRAIAT